MHFSFIEAISKNSHIEYTISNLYNKDPTNFEKNIDEIIKHVNNLYYNSGTSEWSDVVYDNVITILKDKYNIDFTSNIGAPIIDGNTVELPYFLGSMNKYKTQKEINNWEKKYKGPYVISAKLDGISALYANNKLYTRGNGSYGRDISYLLMFLNLPYLENMAFRGELIMKKSTFSKKYSSKYANSRNLVCGIINRKFNHSETELYNDIDFVIYDIYSTDALNFSKKINVLEYYNNFTSISFPIVNFIVNENDLSTTNCDNILKLWKNDYDYEIDGIIITNNDDFTPPTTGNPNYAFAYKNNDISIDMNEGVVKQVIWNVSKDNYLKPKIQLAYPITCDNSKVEFVTGFNAKYILQKRIKPGTKLLIGLSGNVIPHIFKVYNSGVLPLSLDYDLDSQENKDYLPNISESYIWSKNNVDLICVNKDNYISVIKRNMMFFKTMDFKCNLQETTLINVYNSLQKYKLHDILNLSLDEWVSVEKVGEKKANTIMTHIKEKLDYNQESKDKNLFIKYLVGSQELDRGFAIKKVKLYINYLFNLSLTSDFDFTQIYNNEYLTSKIDFILIMVENKEAKQITSNGMKSFVNGLIKFNTFMNNLKTNTVSINIPSVQSLILLFVENDKEEVKTNTKSYNIVFSGFRNKDLQDKVEEKGHKIVDTLTKTTHMLVVKDKNKISTKIKKANANNIPVYTIKEFLNLPL